MSESTPRSAALLIDFENIYYFLRNHLPDKEAALNTITDLLQQLKKHISDKYAEQAISLDAYADFDRIEEPVQSDLYLLGVETHNVLGTDHKNAADMRLCIDALDIMYTRPDIKSFILVAGDRDYIPVIQYLKKRGRVVRVVGFPQKSVSGDLLTIVGPEYFIDARQFVAALAAAPKPEPVPAVPGKPAPPAARTAPPAIIIREPDSELGLVDWAYFEERALNMLVTEFGTRREIWVMPFLHKLREEISQLTEPERKKIVKRLELSGALKIETRQGTPHDYSVILLNWNHPRVQRLS